MTDTLEKKWHCLACGWQGASLMCPTHGGAMMVPASIAPSPDEDKEPSPKSTGKSPLKTEQDEIRLGAAFVKKWNGDGQRFRSKTADLRDPMFWFEKRHNDYDAGWIGGAHAQAIAVHSMSNTFQVEKAPPRLRSASRISGALRLAVATPGILTTQERWDADAYALGISNARKVDIRTGKTLAQHRDDLISLKTSVAPDPDCPTPYLNRVLDHMCGGDADLRRFYLTALGLSVIGDNLHGKAFFWVGGGGSGKSTLLSAAKVALGDYATALNRQTLEGHSGQHMTFLADLIGARMAVISELEGEDLNVARFKALTGQESLQVNRMRRDPVDFTSSATMHVAVNPDHLPRIKIVDDAIRRRVLMVPAGATLPDDQQDPEVKRAVLGDEQPGILAALITAAHHFYLDGQLLLPTPVKIATANYFKAADPVGQWVDERCVAFDGKTEATMLYGNFADWWMSTRQSGTVISMTSWGRAMTKLDFPTRKSGVNFRQGIRINYKRAGN